MNALGLNYWKKNNINEAAYIESDRKAGNPTLTVTAETLHRAALNMRNMRNRVHRWTWRTIPTL
jgi:hypothetical protein